MNFFIATKNNNWGKVSEVSKIVEVWGIIRFFAWGVTDIIIFLKAPARSSSSLKSCIFFFKFSEILKYFMNLHNPCNRKESEDNLNRNLWVCFGGGTF